MTPDRMRRSITALRIVLGIVVLIQSVQALLPRGAGLHGSPLARVVPVLAGVEILGALLMLVPRTARLGAGVLIGVFAAAIVLHGLHGDWNVGGLVVYAASAWVVLASAEPPDR
jgi:uncharacterized membrane protein YphA (DoxX/SURF4 family)